MIETISLTLMYLVGIKHLEEVKLYNLEKLLLNSGGEYWVVNIEANGSNLWEKSFGGDRNEEINSISQTNDVILDGITGSTIPVSVATESDFW